MSQAEQSRLFIKGLSTDFWHKIFTRLSIKEPDHDPDDFWPLEDVRKAGEYVLNGTNLLKQHQNPTLWITCGLYKGTQRFFRRCNQTLMETG